MNKKLLRRKGSNFMGKFLCLSMVLVLLLSLSLPVFASSERKKDEFRVGMECGYAPFNWTQLNDENDAVKIEGTSEYANGYDVQVARKLADYMGKELVIVKITWDGLVPSLTSENIDAIIAGMSATTDRKKEIDFSDHYYYSDLVLVVRNDGGYENSEKLEDFSGARITGQLGTLHYDVIEQIDGVIKEKALKDFPNMIVALQSGAIDGYVSERPGAISATTANSNLKFIDFPSGEGFIFDDEEVTIGVGVRKNDPVVNDINAALTEISEEQREEIMTTAIKSQPQEDAGSEGDGFFASVGSILKRYWPHFLKGTATTLFIALTGTIIGLFIGLLTATVKAIPVGQGGNVVFGMLHRLVNIIISIYVEIFRGTPMMVQAMVFFYGFAYIFKDSASSIRLSPLVAAIIVISVNTGAYMSEVVRGGIDSVDSGQMEAGKAIGMSDMQTMFSVVIPQAIRNILPATGNEFVINIKDTSVFNVIMVTELYYVASDVRANTLKIFESFFIIAIIYLILTFTITRILRFVEHKMDGPQNYTLTSSTMPETVTLHQKQGGK